MTDTERRAASYLAGIYALRMLGLFMILPVFSLYADQLHGTTPALVGLAIGAYGLAQAVLQIPVAVLSDKIGRKPVIIVGLLIFAAGSIMAAQADSIWGVIIGRSIQGAGAIAAVLMALAADLTRDEVRLRVMAMIGMTIGLSFAISLVLGPVLNQWIGVPGIFWLIALLSLVAIPVVKFGVPDPKDLHVHRETEAVPALFWDVLKDRELLRVDFGVLVLHMILTAMFVVMPLAMRDYAGLEPAHHWYVYLPVMVFAMGLMVPFVIYAEKKRHLKGVFTGAIATVVIAALLLAALFHSVAGIVFALLVYFTAFNVLEATMPSLVAKLSPPDRKGTAMGIFSTAQFLGAFIGGVAGGTLHHHFGIPAVFVFCAVAALVWWLVASGMAQPRYLSTHTVTLGVIDVTHVPQIVARLRQVPGVAEAVVVAEDGVAYLKVDLSTLDRDALKRLSAASEAA